MIEVYLRALENRLMQKAEVKLVDHWNNQPANYENEKNILPAVYIDFGGIQWAKEGSNIKVAKATINIHCVNKNTRPTDNREEEKDGKRLKRFDLTASVLAALDGFSTKDGNGNVIIQSMLLAGSEMDTNHDALTDDVLSFSCLLYYYNTWNDKATLEAVIESLTLKRVDTLPA